MVVREAAWDLFCSPQGCQTAIKGMSVLEASSRRVFLVILRNSQKRGTDGQRWKWVEEENESLQYGQLQKIVCESQWSVIKWPNTSVIVDSSIFGSDVTDSMQYFEYSTGKERTEHSSPWSKQNQCLIFTKKLWVQNPEMISFPRRKKAASHSKSRYFSKRMSLLSQGTTLR